TKIVICNIDVSCRTYSHTHRHPKAATNRTGYSVGIHLNKIRRIRYVDGSISIQCESGGKPATGHRRYHSIEVHLADAGVIGICDVKVARRVHGDATAFIRKIKRGIDGRASVAREALLSISGYRRNDSVRVDLANALVSPVGDIDIAFRI